MRLKFFNEGRGAGDPATRRSGVFQMWLNDSLIVRSVSPTHDGEFPDPCQARSEPIRLEAGRAYRLRGDGQESYGEAQLELLWAPPSGTTTPPVDSL